MTMLHDCKPPPSREAAFHLLPKALKRSGMCSVRAAELDGVSGVCYLETCSEPANVSMRMRALWNRSKLRW